ncbi:MAG TPA: ATP phosphoribosyltransferase regulatory subunit [Coriobacteriia bacterium]
MRPITPRGFRDVLFQEAAERDALTASIGDVFSSWGYRRVETPAVEEAAVLEAGMGALDGTAFRLVDLDGRLLALRPEMTVPIARLVASRLAGEPVPVRIAYAAEVYREHASLRGQARQFTQVGVELVGASGPAADAEVVAVLVEALAASGLRDFLVALGTVAILRDLLRVADAPPEWSAEVMAACHDRDLVALDRLVGDAGLAPVLADALTGVPRVRGRREAIDAVREMAGPCGCADVLDALAETWTLLEAVGVAASVTLDFGVLRDFGYYTGLVVEAYARGLGVPLGGGGRYDGLLATFGHDEPAAGFALGLDRLHIALAEQGVAPKARGIDAVLAGHPKASFAAARDLRAAGWRVWVTPARGGREAVAEAGRLDAPETLLAEDDGRIVRLDRDGEPSLPLDRPLPEPPTTTWASARSEG